MPPLLICASGDARPLHGFSHEEPPDRFPSQSEHVRPESNAQARFCARGPGLTKHERQLGGCLCDSMSSGISGLVVEYIVAIDVTRVRFPADALFLRCPWARPAPPRNERAGRAQASGATSSILGFLLLPAPRASNLCAPPGIWIQQTFRIHRKLRLALVLFVFRQGVVHAGRSPRCELCCC